MKRACVWAIALSLFLAPAAFAGDWPHLRGPNLDGRVVAAGPLQGEQVGLDLTWTTPLGSGYSGIAISEGRAVTLYSDGESDWVAAFDVKNGKRLWRQRIDVTNKGHDGSDDGPLSSPVISDGVVYALGPTGALFALRLNDGKQVWTKKLPKDFGSEVPEFGFTTTPLVEGKVLVVQTGGAGGKAISGIDKKSGKTLWSLGDEKVEYQSPALIELAGRRQVVTVSGKHIRGIDPGSGDVLWDHELGEKDWVNSSNPTTAGDNRILLFAGGEAAVFGVKRSGDGFELKELYRSKELGNTYASPVYHDDHLYGFKGQFLTCMNAETGERVWKSRPPGGRGLILVDGNLVVFGSEGNVVIVEATPEAYNERARLRALDGSGYTWPSYADGNVFVRNLKSMASVSITSGSSSSPTRAETAAAAAMGSDFGRFVAQVEESSDKSAVVDRFYDRYEHFPVLEHNYAHFIYRGDVNDIAITGTMIASGNAESMDHIEGTDLYFKTYELEPGGRWEYQFQIDFGSERIPDPRNPRTVPGPFGDQKLSVVTTPGYEMATHLAEPPAGRPRGELQTLTYKSDMLGDEREIQIYLPPGYADGESRYPLLIVHQGKDWVERGLMPHTLDNLIGERVTPVIVAFVSPRGEWWLEGGGSGTDDYTRMLAEELVPYLQEKYRLIEKPGARAVMGTGYFGATAAYVALKYPEVFGNVAVQSVALGLGSEDALMELIGAADPKRTRVYLDWNRYETRRVDSDVDLAQDNRRLAQALERNGLAFTGGEVLDSYGWGSWRARTDAILETFFPVE